MPVLASLIASAVLLGQQDATSSGEPNYDVVVTGERVARTLQTTSSSVFVIEQGELETSSADRIEDVLDNIPNVQLGNGSRGPAIRGLDSTGPLSFLPAFLGGNRPRTTIVVDGRPATYNEFVFGAFPMWDVARVEVFRSPQTTTQGRNSIAGAIFINTNPPESYSNYRVRAIAGNSQTRQFSAVLSAPIAGDSVAFRLAGDARYSRSTSKITDIMRGGDPAHDVFGLLRAKLLVAPSLNTAATVTYLHSQSQAPQINGVSAPFKMRRDTNPNYGIFRVKVDALTGEFRHNLNADVTSKIIVSAGRTKADRLARANFGEAVNEGADWSVEGTLNWQPETNLRFIAGLSRTHEKLEQSIDLSLISGLTGQFTDQQDGLGIFVDGSLPLTSRTTLTGGLRYQRDRQLRRGTISLTSSNTPANFLGSFEAWLPKVTLSHEMTPNLHLGASVQKAYNPGGSTFRFDTASVDEFKAEKLWDYELYARASAAGGRASFAANLFYYDIRNSQRALNITVFTPTGLPVQFARLFNVPRASSYGAEGQVDWRINARLSASAALGFLNTKIIETDIESASLDGKTFDRSPRFSLSAAIDWKPRPTMRISARFRHHSSYFSDPANSPALRVKSARTVDVRAEYELGRAVLFGYVRNVFDAFYLRDLRTPTTGEAGDPRLFALGIESRF